MALELHHIVKWSCVFLFLHIVKSQGQDYNRDNNNNRDPNDPYNRNRDQYNSDNRSNDPYNRDPYNRSNDPYNRSNDPYNRNNDPYNRYNQSGNYDPYNRNLSDPYNRYNQSGNYDPYNRNQNDPYNRNQSGFNRNDPYNRNDPFSRNPNDPYNRNPNDPYNKNPNDPYNRNPNDPYNRNTNDPYNRNPNDPYNRNINDPYNRDRGNDPYNRNPNDPYNRNPNDPYNKDPNRGNDPYNRDRDRDRFGNNFGQDSNFGSGGVDDSNCCEEYCYDIDEQPYVKLSSKTPYQFAYGKVSNQHIVPQCKPVQFWSLIREGTSIPDRISVERYKQLHKIHDELIRNYEERRSFPSRGRLCAGDYDNLRRWHWNDSFSEHNAMALTQQGSDDIKFLARRFQSRLRDLLVPYNENHYSFQYTEGDRSHDSYQAYAEGLFGHDAARVHASVRTNPNSGYSSNPQNSNYDPFTRNENSYQSSSSFGLGGGQYGGGYNRESKCKSYQQRMDEDKSTSAEYQAFKQKQDYKDLVRNVFRRLGFRYSLNDTIIEDMYDVCRYEKSWYVTRPSPWCGAFTKEQLKLLEYGDDVFHYYKSGYGHEHLNKNLGCGLMKDMYDRFERTVNGNQNEQKAIFHFRDLDTLLKTLVAFDIGRDQSVLTADNYFQLTRRNWRLADLAPFSGNLAAILYQCDSQSSSDQFKVMFFLNENPVDFPQCSVGLCSWETIKQKYQYAAQECRLDWCERGSANLPTISIIISAVVLIIHKLL